MNLRTRRVVTCTLACVVLTVGLGSIQGQQPQGRVRLTTPRIAPVEVKDLTDEQREALGPMAPNTRPTNTRLTIANHPKLLAAWMGFNRYIGGASTLTAHDRELLVLRTLWLSGTEGEWGNHARGAGRLGLTDADLLRITQGPDAAGWSPFDAALLRAADELHGDQFITDRTWQALATRYSREQMLDAVFTVGQYTMVSMLLNSAGTPPEPGVEIKFPQAK